MQELIALIVVFAVVGLAIKGLIAVGTFSIIAAGLVLLFAAPILPIIGFVGMFL